MPGLRTFEQLTALRQELRGVSADLSVLVGIVQDMDRQLASVGPADGDASESPSPSLPLSSSQQPPQGHVSVLPTPESEIVAKLREAVKETKKAFRMEREKLIGLYYSLDVGSMPADVQLVIQSFKPVSPESVRDAVDAFLQTGGEKEKDDLSLYFKVGANIDGLVEREVPPHGKESMTALMHAASSGSLETVTMLTDAGADVEVRDPLGLCALHHAAVEGKADITRFLASRGADLNAKAAKGNAPLALAVCTGQTDTAALLVELGADVNAEDNDGTKAIHYAAKWNRRDCAEMLLNHNANVNEPNAKMFTPLLCCLDTGTLSDVTDTAQFLVSRGADVNYAIPDSGLSILHMAATVGSVNLATVLLNNGADMHVVTNESQSTALHCVACHMGQVAERLNPQKVVGFARLLIERGINVNATNWDGLTARTLALQSWPNGSPVYQFFAGLQGP
uniref:Uncharacterized protein n=1 Tax=Chromera velia CCMP2878 TaxID=1169474 RepID=A0A0G4IAC7_9ALVE|eukprot:Cvel_12446.t1-p1 / transcript=Cvel_12446.t1 / gene=Cvel_12446 / organism=Chromera_velia_CCMP2878 / gene_product=Putative ankyrin repeat protein RF_0381, putative / transcript_product=Putative ankyrin repeat protein RF_0381, putative / location=Cvel_scaffold815:17118-18470(-) / protein_length=451 / sequence_SO=supercontig / SO=protein_coding / is_pseudo=false